MTQRKTTQPDSHNPYSGEPKVGVGLDDVKALRLIAGACNVVLLPMEVSVDGQGVRVAGSPRELTSLPVGLIGFMSLTKATRLSMRKVREKLQTKFACTLPEEIELGKAEQGQAVASALARRLIALHESIARRNVQLMRGMAAIRESHELTQEAFQRLEQFAYARNLLSRDLALSLEPTKYAVGLGGAASAFSLKQMLPVSSVGVCELAIHLPQESRFTDGELQVDLVTLEDGKTVHRWTVPGGKLVRGWLHLGLVRALDTDAKSLLLSLNWSGHEMLTLSLAMAHPQEQWCVSTPLQVFDRVLSLKAWTSLPSVRPAASPNVFAGEGSAWQSALLGRDVLETVENLSGAPESVGFIPEARAIRIHPITDKVVWGRLRGAIPAGVSSIRARIETVNAQAGPVEYAMAVVPTEHGARFRAAEGSDDQLPISQWTRMAAVTPGEIHLYFNEPTSEAADLYLGTRLRAGDSDAYCWAQFSSIALSSSFGPIG